MKTYIFSLVFMLAVKTFADGVCDDLGRFSCAPGRYDDGTGSVISSNEFSAKLITFSQNTRGALGEEVLRIIRTPEGRYFRDNALNVLGMTGAPGCEPDPATGALQTACEQNLKDGIAGLVLSQSMGNTKSQNNKIANPTDLRFIISDPNFRTLSTFVAERADRELVNHDLVNRMRTTIYPDVKNLIIARINQLNIPDATKRYMVTKISGIQFEGYDCSSRTQETPQINHLLTVNASYDHERNTFRFCNGFLMQSTSEFSMVTVIAHELAHSIDPCRINSGPEGRGFRYTNEADIERSQREYPFTNVVQCLRLPESVHAVNFPLQDQRQQQIQMQIQMQQQHRGLTPGGYYNMGGIASSSGTGTVSGTGSVSGTATVSGTGTVSGTTLGYGGQFSTPSMAPPPSLCNSDQITESFSDWLAAEVLPAYMESHHQLTPAQYQTGYGNAFRMGCDTDAQGSSRDKHPPMQARINRIILVNPRIRAQMGCTAPARATYCDSERTYAPAIEAGIGGGMMPGIGMPAGGVPGVPPVMVDPAPPTQMPSASPGSVQ